MKKIFQSPFTKIIIGTLIGMFLGYLLGNSSLFTGIGFALGLAYGFLENSNAEE